MRKRAIALAGLAVVGVLALAGPAIAAPTPYPAPPPDVTVNRSTITAGGTLEITGSGYTPNGDVEITITERSQAAPRARTAVMVPVAYTLPTRAATINVVASSDGTFVTFYLFGDPGVFTITALDVTTGLFDTSTVLVLGGGGLPVTGSDGGVLTMILIGSALAAVGIVIVVLARSRRRPAVLRSEI